MTTDVNNEPEKKIETKTEPEPEKTLQQPVTDPAESFMSKLDALLDQKIKAATEDLNKKIEEQNKQLTQKNAEIDQLKQANANMALTSNFNKASDGVIDYSSKDFDEIDWNPQAKSLLTSIDKKVFDLKEDK